MRKIILTLFFMAATLLAKAQDVVAYEAPDMVQCGYEIFDLTVQTPIILGNQDPENYTVMYYLTQADAVSGVNPLTNTMAFVPFTQPQTVYASVIYNETGEFATTSFDLIVGSGPGVPQMQDIYSCSSYTLPALAYGNYYTNPNGPNGGGTMIAAGTAITTSVTVYIYAQNTFGCISESSFDVNIGQMNIGNFFDVTACGAYTLPALQGNYEYYTLPGGPAAPGNVQIFPGDVITANQTVYVYISNGEGCTGEASYIVTIMDESDFVPPNPLVTCDVENGEGYGVFNLGNIYADFTQLNPTANNLMLFLTQNEDGTLTDGLPFDVFINTQPFLQTIYLQFTGPCGQMVFPLELVVQPCGNGGEGLSGIVTLDEDGDGCDESDNPAAGVLVAYNSGNYVYYTFTNIDGQYFFANVPEGPVTIWIQNINGQNFTANPTAVTIDYPNSTTENNFCISVPAPYTDVATYVFPYTQAVPGFTAGYYVAVTNYGTETASGTATLTFNDILITPTYTDGATLSGNTLTWTYSNLAPYQTIYYYVWGVVATPPTVVSGTQLVFISSVTPVSGDVNVDNNTYTYNQYAVNSFDPNDITVHEGEYITETQADGFLHYTVRFQNTGDYIAQNVKIDLDLDEKLDWTTFQPIGASHLYNVSRNGSDIEFKLDGINLPAEQDNEPASHGFVSFRVKPVADAEVGDSMSETAAIYFDFNEPIITNTATTTITSTAAVANNKAKVFTLYPNPATDKVTLKLNGAEVAQVKISDVLGKTLYTGTVQNNGTINVSQLPAGIYMVTVLSGKTTQTGKLIRK